MIVKCQISGVLYATTSFNNPAISPVIGTHPIFNIEHSCLVDLVKAETKGILKAEETYLLFLTIMDYSGLIDWECPLTPPSYDEKCLKKLAENIPKAISIIDRYYALHSRGILCPRYIVRKGASLNGLYQFINVINDTINDFLHYKASKLDEEILAKAEKTLTDAILLGQEDNRYTLALANWAEKAADFPDNKSEYYKRIIRTCISPAKIFSIPLEDIKEVKEYCELNILAGSIHFHALHKILTKGIKNHMDYLGFGEYTLVSVGDKIEIATECKPMVIANAPKEAPKREDYKSSLDFLKAKLAYNANKY